MSHNVKFRIMENRLPGEIFNHTALAEQPQRLAHRPSRQEVIGIYNAVYDRLQVRRTNLEDKLRNGEFEALPVINAKITGGQPLTPEEQMLIGDYVTLLDAQTAVHGRRNLNAAHAVEAIKRDEAAGRPQSAASEEIREHYQAGNFHLIEGLDHPLEQGILTDRFVVPVCDGGQNFAVIDGAPVEGFLRLIDREMREAQSLPWRARNHPIAQRRHERDVLFTSSSPLFDREDSIFHARGQLEAYYNYIDELRREWYLPDWFNSEWLLRERRVLDIPQQERGRRRLGCLLLPLPFLIPFLFALSINPSPCYGTGGQLRTEVFDPSKVEKVSIEGADQRELAYHLLGWRQIDYSPADNPEMRDAIFGLHATDPELVNAYLRIARQDHVRTAQQIRADQSDNPFLDGTDFTRYHLVAVSCLSPDERMKRAKQEIDRKNNPQLMDRMTDAWNWLQRHIPQVRIDIR